MKFDIESNSEGVQAFVLQTINQFFQEAGRASVVRFDVQAIYGQIHAYPSTRHTPATIFDLVGTPVRFIHDCESWIDHFNSGDEPSYRNHPYDSAGGNAAFDDYISVMVQDAVLACLPKIPDEQLPVAIVVESAPENGGAFHRTITPQKDG